MKKKLKIKNEQVSIWKTKNDEKRKTKVRKRKMNNEKNVICSNTKIE